MLLIKDTLRHDAFPLPNMSGLEATAVCLQLQNQKRLIFVSTYLPPTITIAQADLDAVFSSQCPVVLAGDFNCKHIAWNNVTVNSNGDSLLAYCLNKAISINYPDQPTHYPYNSHPSVLDIALSHHCTTSKPQAISTLSSDHDPIVFKVHLRPELLPPKVFYDYNRANWPLFRSYLDQSLDPKPTILLPPDLDRAITSFTQTIQQAATTAIPRIPRPEPTLHCLPTYSSMQTQELLPTSIPTNSLSPESQPIYPLFVGLYNVPQWSPKHQMDLFSPLITITTHPILETQPLLHQISNHHSPTQLSR